MQLQVTLHLSGVDMIFTKQWEVLLGDLKQECRDGMNQQSGR